MRYFIEFSYNGKNYFGYQIQPNQISIQEVLEKSLSLILREDIKTIGAGRTDTGVHSKKIFAHFDTQQNLSENLVERLNAFLPSDISIHRIFKVKENLHARFSAIYRTYNYFIYQGKDPFRQDFSWQIRKKILNIEKMNQACEILFEYDDFSSFAKVGADNKTNLCRFILLNGTKMQMN